MLELVGVHIDYNTEPENYNGIQLAFGPKVLLDPTFALTLNELKNKFKGNNRISKDSTLVLKGKEASIENLNLNGYLRVEESQKATGDVENNERVILEHSTEEDPEVYRIRGYKPKKV